VASLTALDTDRWVALLPHVRAAAGDLADAGELAAAADHGQLAALRDTPATRLVGGRRRRELATQLATDPALWAAVVARVRALDPVPETLAWLDEAAGEDVGSGPGDVDATAAERARRDLDRARERLRTTRDDRDRWRRRAEGTQARLDAVTAELDAARDKATALAAELADTAARLARAEEERTRAVDRERRRRDAEVARLGEELAATRRAEEERRQVKRREREARDQARRAAAEAEAEARRTAVEAGRTRVVPGRPTRLPEGVAPDTTEAARLLLHPGRWVLVDGYNVTLTHRGHLGLEQQRAWLVQLLATLVSTRRIVPQVVFDGRAAGGARPPAARGVEVRFTEAGISADDELVLAVEGSDEPVVVVTDDRELRTRVQLGGADVVGTRSLLGVVG
jgi:hypothetical protein